MRHDAVEAEIVRITVFNGPVQPRAEEAIQRRPMTNRRKYRRRKAM